jgi:hypothetical protein
MSKDDYEIIKNAFKDIKSIELRKRYDTQGNPVLRVKIGNIRMIFIFDVDEFKDEARFKNLIVWEKQIKKEVKEK